MSPLKLAGIKMTSGEDLLKAHLAARGLPTKKIKSNLNLIRREPTKTPFWIYIEDLNTLNKLTEDKK